MIDDEGHLRWIRGAGKRPRYVGFGSQPHNLYGIIDDLRGARGLLERATLRLVGSRAAHRVTDETIESAWSRLVHVLPELPRSALLIHTGYYKSTILAGPVVGNRPLFSKVFTHPLAHAAEAGRADELRAILPPSIVTPRLEIASDGVACYTVLRRRCRANRDQLEEAALLLGRSAWEQRRDRPAEEWEEVVAGVREGLRQLGIGIPEQRIAPVPLVPAHGDFTPWNAFVTDGGQVALVDFERVGRRAPFNDLWHLHTQPLALRGLARLPHGGVDVVRRATRTSCAEAVTWFAAYLVEELAVDLEDWHRHGRRHPQLLALIRTRAALLAEQCVQDQRQ